MHMLFAHIGFCAQCSCAHLKLRMLNLRTLFILRFYCTVYCVTHYKTVLKLFTKTFKTLKTSKIIYTLKIAFKQYKRMQCVVIYLNPQNPQNFKNPQYYQNPQNTQNPQNPQNPQNHQNTQNPQNPQNPKNTQNT